MELFLAVCEAKSISKASEENFVSQQGISKMIKDLEEELGCKLLIRTKTGVQPTECGEYFQAECRHMLNRKNYLSSNISRIADAPHELLRLGMAFGVIAAIPYSIIVEFERDYPRVKVDYSDRIDMHLESLLKKDEYDFALTTGVFDADELIAEKLAEETVFLCVPRTHALFSADNIGISDLENVGFAMFGTQFFIRHNFEESCRRNGFSPKIEISSNDFNSLKEVAYQNGLLFIVPEHTPTDDTSDFRYFPFPDPLLKWEIFFVKKKNKVMTENSEAFYRHIKNRT